MSKNIIITGDTSGIGLEIVKEFIKKGHNVYGISRRNLDSLLTNYQHYSADICNETEVKNAIQEILKQVKTIDLVINCAGFGIAGPIESTSLIDAKKQFNVNFFGMVNINKELIPTFRSQRKGAIVNISSVAGVAPIPYQAYYSATKAAINSYSMALANELRIFNVHVVAIQPGDIKTGFTDARLSNTSLDEEYQHKISKSIKTMEHDERNGMSAIVAAKYIIKVANKKRPKPIYTIGFGYKLLVFLIKILPLRLVNFLIYLLY